jgi:iron complex transport system substrate-binding protein
MNRRAALAMAASAGVLGAFGVASLAGLGACSRAGAEPRRATGARRIVSLAPSMTEALFAIGAGDRVVGRSRFCNFPPEARPLTVVGDVEPDLEAVLALDPDLVVGVDGLSSGRLAANLAARHVSTWFPFAGSLGAVDAVIVGLGERVGHAEDARGLVRALDEREGAIARAVAGAPRPRVLMVVALGPVVVAGPKSFAHELIRYAGGENAVPDGDAWPTLGFEKIVDLDPDVVIDATLVGTDEATRIGPGSAGWRAVGAVQAGRVLAMRDERVLRAGPRVGEGLAVLARMLHPRAAVP